jgi:chorismate mutase/prephenate dehydratase
MAEAQPDLCGVYFYIDIQGHPDQDHVRTALEELRKVCGFFKILGTYPVDVH